MVKYRYAVSLRLRHPTAPLHEYTTILGLIPWVEYKVGEPRRTRHGSPLPGFNKQSFWNHDFPIEDDDDLEGFLMSTADQLSVHAPAFKQLSDSGGHAEFFIGIFLESRTAGFTMPATLLGKCAELRIELEICLYTWEAEGSCGRTGTAGLDLDETIGEVTSLMNKVTGIDVVGSSRREDVVLFELEIASPDALERISRAAQAANVAFNPLRARARDNIEPAFAAGPIRCTIAPKFVHDPPLRFGELQIVGIVLVWQLHRRGLIDTEAANRFLKKWNAMQLGTDI